MTTNDMRRFDMDFPNGFEEGGQDDRNSSAFVVLPMFCSAGYCCQTAASAQYTLCLLACQQAAAVVGQLRRRRQMLSTRGVHRWN